MVGLIVGGSQSGGYHYSKWWLTVGKVASDGGTGGTIVDFPLAPCIKSLPNQSV